MTVTFSHLGSYGRMGNSLFQASAAIGYAKKYNVPFIFPKWKHQNEFQIPESVFVNKNEIKNKNRYIEKSFTYSEIPFKENCDLHGYFQSWKYFNHCENYIRQVFTPKEAEDPSFFRDTCCIHVRRGDYLKFKNYHPVQTMDYYNKAIEKIPCNKFLIFSDDVKWCKKNFIGKKFIVSEPASSLIDFKMMIACNHFIIGNSSFSWWAAWLSEHDDKVIVAPNNWFGSKLIKTNPTHDLIPPEWIIV